jgi:hypothetical protein
VAIDTGYTKGTEVDRLFSAPTHPGTWAWKKTGMMRVHDAALFF